MAFRADADDDASLYPFGDGAAEVALIKLGLLANVRLRRLSVAKIVRQHLFVAANGGATILRSASGGNAMRPTAARMPFSNASVLFTQPSDE